MSASASAPGRLVDSGIEPELKRRRLLDAGGPVEDEETARQKMKDARVYMSGDERVSGDESVGFDPNNVRDKKHKYSGHYYQRREDNLITPMGYFAREGDVKMMRWLYVHGADTRDEDVDFWFPMYAAAQNGKVEACRWLAEHGASEDVRRRCKSESPGSNGIRPLRAASLIRAMGRWLILNGALNVDNGTRALDINLLTEDLKGSSLSRLGLLDWAEEEYQRRKGFAVFLQGTLHIPMPSPQKLLSELTKRNRSECAATRILKNTPPEQYKLLWDDLYHTPVKLLRGKAGILELISDFAGVMHGREALILRQLREILPGITDSEEHELHTSESDEYGDY